jgi:hypothetical protein
VYGSVPGARLNWFDQLSESKTMTDDRISLAILLLLSIGTAHSNAQAQSNGPTSSDQWKFTVAPYLMMPWMDGTAAVKGREIDVNIAPSEILSNLQFGAMGAFEARKGKWAVGVDAIYMALGTTVDTPPADIDFNQGAYTFTGLRQLNDKVDFVFGTRWNVLQSKLGFKGPMGATLEETKQWVDPIVGLKWRQPLGGKWHFTLQGDIGGFGAGSDFAWHLFPVIGVDVGKRATLGVGYRVLGVDYRTGSQDNLFKYDVVTQAFVLGAAFHF